MTRTICKNDPFDETNTFRGVLEFRTGGEAVETGVFLLNDCEEPIEVLAITSEARAPLGIVEAHPEGVQARIAGVIRSGIIEATDIEIPDPDHGITQNLGDALLALYDEVCHEPACANPPRRHGNNYLHPNIPGRVLERIPLDVSTDGVHSALYDQHSGDVWFRTVDFSASCGFEDIVRGPYKLPSPKTQAGRPGSDRETIRRG